MEAMDFKKYSDEEFKEALRATLNLKKEWMASVTRNHHTGWFSWTNLRSVSWQETEFFIASGSTKTSISWEAEHSISSSPTIARPAPRRITTCSGLSRAYWRSSSGKTHRWCSISAILTTTAKPSGTVCISGGSTVTRRIEGWPWRLRKSTSTTTLYIRAWFFATTTLNTTNCWMHTESSWNAQAVCIRYNPNRQQ